MSYSSNGTSLHKKGSEDGRGFKIHLVCVQLTNQPEEIA